MDDIKTVTDPSDNHVPQQEDSASTAERGPELEALAAERDRLAAEKSDLHDRLLRRTAEFDNFRRRAERERVELLEYAGMDTVRPLLPILDDFERALRVAREGDEFAKGMHLIYQRFAEALKKLGVEPIIAVGQPFDPNLHHAVEMVQTDEAEDQTVLEEYQAGYNFRGRLLRPAMVKVAVKP
jgi:molecular chaperone GrpE